MRNKKISLTINLKLHFSVSGFLRYGDKKGCKKAHVRPMTLIDFLPEYTQLKKNKEDIPSTERVVHFTSHPCAGKGYEKHL